MTVSVPGGQAAGKAAAPAGGESEAASPELRRTLRFAVSVAAQLELPCRAVQGGHSVGTGFYFEAQDGEPLEPEEVAKVAARLQELVQAQEKVMSTALPSNDAVAYFKQHQQVHAVSLLETRVTAQVQLHECSGVLRLALFPLLTDLGPLERCTIAACAPGFVAAYAGNGAPEPALMWSHGDHIAFARSQGVMSVGAMNALSQLGRGQKDYVLNCEFRQEAKLASVAERIVARSTEGRAVRVICIAGPTSSGKTTFANKLCLYLRNAGLAARTLTVDHYYLPLAQQPKYQIRQQVSDVDFDHIESMDIELVSEHIKALVDGKSIVPPVYNMRTSDRDPPGPEFPALPKKNGVLVIEGIHALNPLYTQAVPPEKVFKIFTSPLMALQLDDCNAVKSTDHRLLRRMCRDYNFRGRPAAATLGVWDKVRNGDHIYIFPFQNSADFVLNSSADYELAILKTYLEPLLRQVTPVHATYAKAAELLQLLDHFVTWPPHVAPPAALLREFIGDGAFDCH